MCFHASCSNLAPQYFVFYDGGDRAGCYHRVTAGWPISRLDTTAIGGSWDAPTQALVLFQVRPAPSSRAQATQALARAGPTPGGGCGGRRQPVGPSESGHNPPPLPENAQIKEGHYVAFIKGATEVVGKSIASNIATFAAAQAQVKGCGRCQEHKAASLPRGSAYAQQCAGLFRCVQHWPF
jgi:hypothetical protein